MPAAAEPAPRVWIAHRLDGRTRLRFTPARIAELEAANARAALAGVPGVTSARVDARAGSALCEHAPALDPSRLVAALRAGLPAAQPATPPAGSAVARELSRAFSGLNRDVLDATEGRLDIGTLATFGFVGAGALEVAVSRRLPMPPWFNLAWWGLRTFLALEREPARDQDRKLTKGGGCPHG